jgi:hypothetical protein
VTSHDQFRRLKTPIICFAVLALAAAVRGGDQTPATPVDEGAYETDRPGELENPFTLPPGGTELVNYVVGMNAAAREDDFGNGGSAVFVDTALRFGVVDRLEGVLAIDSFLQADPPSGSGAGSKAGIGYATLTAKWNFLRDPAGDFGISLAPFIRFPLDQAIGGSPRAESGLVVPFDVDLENGWEMEGSSGVSRAPEGLDDWSWQWENQASLERELAKQLTAYLELQLQAGEGLPEWATEFGVTYRLNASVRIDIGTSLGIGRNSRGRMGYAGIGWRF